MKTITFTFFTLIFFQPAGADQNWNQFRGPGGSGVSDTNGLPVEFDESLNVRWKIAIPESGWSSPVVWGNEVWLTTGSDEKRELRVICVDIDSGKIVKNIKVFEMVERVVDPAYAHDSPHLNSPATPTAVVEQDRVYVSFGSQGIASLDRATGEKLWERRDLRVYQPVRQGSSPIVDDQNLYVAFDGTDQQFFVALDKRTGDTRWKADRNVSSDWEATLRTSGLSTGKGGKPNDNKKSFATATLIEVGGRRQLIAPAAEATISYDPATGKELWRVMHPGGFNVSARPVFENGLVYVFTSGLTGYLMAIRPDGRGDVTETHVVWSTTRGTPGIPSPVVVDDMLFMVTDKGGIARCLDSNTGDEVWRQRLGGDHWASPLLADGNLYFSSKQGDVTVLSATREEPNVRVENKMNASFIASPAVSDDSLILRSTTHLYCLAEGHARTEQQVAADAYPDSDFTVTRMDDKSDIDWDAAYEKLLAANPDIKQKVDSGGASKEDVIAWMKSQLGAKARKGGKAQTKNMSRGKPGARPNSIKFYAIVIGKLKSKDIELGELEMEVEYVIGNGEQVKAKILGKRVRLVGVAGPFLDNLLQIKRGETIKVRTGDYNANKQELGFGYKFQVLERTAAFYPEDFGVPPQPFRGFRGELIGKVVEASGFEVLLEVHDVRPTDGNQAEDANIIRGKRVRIAGFYSDHSDAYADLHHDDVIRVSVMHRNPKRDALDVTDQLAKLKE